MKLILGNSVVSRQAIIVVALVCLTSCASVRPYPFCTFDGVPSKTSYDNHLGKVKKVLSSGLFSLPNKSTNIDINGMKWMIIDASNISHKNIRRVWPALACFSEKQYSDGLGARKYRTCLLTVQRNLENHRSIVMDKETNEFSGDEIDSDSTVPGRLLWCNGWETL